jgi:hypothetical protein
MATLASWTKEMGWYQTEKSSFWKPKDEFVGLKDGYFCVIAEWRGRITLQVPFSPDVQKRSKEIGAAIKRQRRLFGCTRALAVNNGLTLIFEGFSLLFQSKPNKVRGALEALIPLLRNMGVYPPGVCECGCKDQLELVKESNTTIHYRCAECAANAKML